MRILFDSNVLISALIENHVNHRSSRQLLDRAIQLGLGPSISTHGLAETYAQLTSIPQLRVSPHVAVASMMRDIERMSIVSLDPQDYKHCLAESRRLSISGGRIYDLLHVVAASKVNADFIATWNAKHFIGICDGTGIAPQTPQSILEQP